MRIIIAEELKKAQQKKNLVFSSVDYNLVADNYQFPLESRIVLLFHLNPSRYLWGSKARYYRPSDLSFEADQLKTEAEKQRDYGKWFEIRPLPAIWLKFKTKNLIIVQFNSGKPGWFKEALETLRPMNLTDLWKTKKFYDQRYYNTEGYHARWLNLYTIKSWRPDLLPKTSPKKKYKSFPGGSSRSLGWNESDHDYENISANFNRSKKFLEKLSFQ